MTLFFASNPYGWAVMGALAGIAVVGIACLLLAKKSHCKNTEKTPIAIGGQFSINDDLGYKMHRALSSLKCDNPTQFSSACFSKIFSR